MIFYIHIYHSFSVLQWLQVIYHGLQLDASLSGYLSIIPGLLSILLFWIPAAKIKPAFKTYFLIVSILISIIFVVDLILYKYWGFRLDSTPLFYMKSPKDALASAGIFTILAGILSMILLSWTLFKLTDWFIIKKIDKYHSPFTIKGRIITSVVALLCLSVLFLPIRGGVTVSTMNVGKVYFSEKMELNHAAVNPAFSLMESLTTTQRFSEQFRFMPNDQAEKLFLQMKDVPVPVNKPERLFKTKRPNVIIVILESFMSKVIEPLGGIPGIAPGMNELCRTGIVFTNFYANSFRTDRGLLSILSAYPAQPNTSLMRYPHKTEHLPSIPGLLKSVGYSLQYYYGGDADFTNMRSYLRSMGIQDIVSDTDFPLKERLSKWGVPDQFVFERAAQDLQKSQKQPFLKIIQTSSSHEPFDVPFHKYPDLYLNAVAYTDSCLSDFIARLRKTNYGDNTVVVLVPDHAMHYPDTIKNYMPERHMIPLIFCGGAINRPLKVDTYASQIDIAATLLGQLEIGHKEFKFSKDILNPASPHFAYYSYPNGFGMLTPDNTYVYDCDSRKALINTGMKNRNRDLGKAFLQVLYNDLDRLGNNTFK